MRAAFLILLAAPLLVIATPNPDALNPPPSVHRMARRAKPASHEDLAKRYILPTSGGPNKIIQDGDVVNSAVVNDVPTPTGQPAAPQITDRASYLAAKRKEREAQLEAAKARKAAKDAAAGKK